MRESLRFTGKIMSATVSRVADRWFASITVDIQDVAHLPKAENQGAVGVDLGVSALATLSGREYSRPEAAQGAAGPSATALAQSEPQAKRLCQPQEGQG